MPTCREYLGFSKGYCTELAEREVQGRHFCSFHAAERLNYDPKGKD